MTVLLESFSSLFSHSSKESETKETPKVEAQVVRIKFCAVGFEGHPELNRQAQYTVAPVVDLNRPSRVPPSVRFESSASPVNAAKPTEPVNPVSKVMDKTGNFFKSLGKK